VPALAALVLASGAMPHRLTGRWRILSPAYATILQGKPVDPDISDARQIAEPPTPGTSAREQLRMLARIPPTVFGMGEAAAISLAAEIMITEQQLGQTQGGCRNSDLVQLVTNRCTKSARCSHPSFRRTLESGIPASDWTPAFAGVTDVEFDHVILLTCT